MPNWCSNMLKIEFDTEDECMAFEHFLSRGEDSNQFDFELVVPCPKEVKHCSPSSYTDSSGRICRGVSYSNSLVKFNSRRGVETRDFMLPLHEAARLTRVHGSNNWYDWNCENWGTKWNSSDAVANFSGSSAIIQFDTAWSPPMPVIYALAEAFPGARIVYRYMETGCDFGGEVTFENGKEINNLDGTARESAKFSDWHAGFFSEDEFDSEEEE